MNDEYSKLTEAVDWFAGQMKKKLHAKTAEGESGWDVTAWVDYSCEARLFEHLYKLLKGDYSQAIDIANYAMFIAHRHRTSEKEEQEK